MVEIRNRHERESPDQLSPEAIHREAREARREGYRCGVPRARRDRCRPRACGFVWKPAHRPASASWKQDSRLPRHPDPDLESHRQRRGYKDAVPRWQQRRRRSVSCRSDRRRLPQRCHHRCKTTPRCSCKVWRVSSGVGRPPRGRTPAVRNGSSPAEATKCTTFLLAELSCAQRIRAHRRGPPDGQYSAPERPARQRRSRIQAR
jgi:hypothetical protein